jgi:hypothetical protein
MMRRWGHLAGLECHTGMLGRKLSQAKDIRYSQGLLFLQTQSGLYITHKRGMTVLIVP